MDEYLLFETFERDKYINEKDLPIIPIIYAAI